jgi:hypothetical protein
LRRFEAAATRVDLAASIHGRLGRSKPFSLLEAPSTASEQINKATGEVNRIAQETADSMTQSAEAVSDLSQLAQELNGLIQELESSKFPVHGSQLKTKKSKK